MTRKEVIINITWKSGCGDHCGIYIYVKRLGEGIYADRFFNANANADRLQRLI